MMKGLIGLCLNHETSLDRIRAKARSNEDELNELKAWKVSRRRSLPYQRKLGVSWRSRQSC